MEDRIYFCIDQRTFFATVECVARGLDPMKTNLVVADPERSVNTICLAITPAMKALGIKNRCRIKDIPPNVDYITATPRMQLYIDCAAEIYSVFLRYVGPEHIHVYSIDEAFLDMTPYLKMYGLPPRELAKKIMDEVTEIVGSLSTCGIGTNLYLCKIALDILAKHSPDGIAYLDEATYCKLLWDHRPITDFWRISDGTAAKLWNRGITTMGGIAAYPEETIYGILGVDAELLIDHAWGRESTTMKDIKNYKSKSKSLSSGQVLFRDYEPKEGLVIVKEMMDQLCLDMVAKQLVTNSITLCIGYSHANGMMGAKGTAQIAVETNGDLMIVPAVAALYERIVDHGCKIRRISLTCNNVREQPSELQLNMFEDPDKQVKNYNLQTTMLDLKARYGKNIILKGFNYDKAATGRERNMYIGGHKSGRTS